MLRRARRIPNLPPPTAAGHRDGRAPAVAGGGRVGLLLLSPFVQAGSSDLVDSYNHFSLLRSVEDLFGLDHLGYAADPALPAFDAAVYNAKPKAASTTDGANTTG